jgi:arylsulfatase A-like enzyme
LPSALCLWLVLCSGACSRDRAAASGLKDYNLVVINIDTLRADHLGCYGYGRNTSPFIDSLAGRGVLFERALSNSSYTRESVAVLFSGRLPSASGSVGWNARPSDTTRNLAELFRDAGYQTGFSSNTTMLTDPLFTKGFDEAEQLTTVWGLSGAGPKLSARAVEFATRHAGGRFMMYLHYLDPHEAHDLIASAPAQRARLRAALDAYVARCRDRQRTEGPAGAAQPTLSDTTSNG